MKILVASSNPVKIEATRRASEQLFPKQSLNVTGQAIESGVGAQPKTDAETLKGALNRVTRLSKIQSADYWVGIEGGIELHSKETYCFGWIVVLSATGDIGKGRSAAFILPQAANKLLHQGKELGDVMDVLHQRSNVKQAEGAIGLLTNNLITRTELYYHPLIIAFSQII